MAVVIEIGGRPFEIAPFMLAELELAADHIDRMSELEQEFARFRREGKVPPAKLAFQLTRELVEIVAVGTVLIDPEMTADRISKSVDFSFLQPLGIAVRELLRLSGLAPEGEAKAPSTRSSRGPKASSKKSGGS